MDQDLLKLPSLNSNRPLPEQFAKDGGLCASNIPYRNVNLSITEYLAIIDHLVASCHNFFTDEEKIEDPKKYFDDALIALRIHKKDLLQMHTEPRSASTVF